MVTSTRSSSASSAASSFFGCEVVVVVGFVCGVVVVVVVEISLVVFSVLVVVVGAFVFVFVGVVVLGVVVLVFGALVVVGGCVVIVFDVFVIVFGGVVVVQGVDEYLLGERPSLLIAPHQVNEFVDVVVVDIGRSNSSESRRCDNVKDLENRLEILITQIVDFLVDPGIYGLDYVHAFSSITIGPLHHCSRDTRYDATERKRRDRLRLGRLANSSGSVGSVVG